jgi:hypothetical protein
MVQAVVALGLACASVPALAEPPAEAFQQRVEKLVRWIAAHSEYPATLKQAPNFVFLPPEVIRHSFAGSSLGYSSQSSSVQAAQVRGAIYLPDTFALGRDDYILVHELVHHLQEESGKRFACMEAREREAYLLQTEFVEETGLGEVPNDMFMLMLRCDVRQGRAKIPSIHLAGKIHSSCPDSIQAWQG